MAAKKTRKSAAPTPLERAPLLEWIMAGLGLACALGAVAFLVWEGSQSGDRAPELVVHAGAVVATPSGYIQEIEVANRSRVTAAAVQVEGALRGGEDESVTLTFDYVPGLGRREGSMTFTRDPRTAGVEVRVTGQVSH